MARHRREPTPARRRLLVATAAAVAAVGGGVPGGGRGPGTRRPDGFGDCFDATTLRLAPAESLTDGAATPPSDGFFDPSASYYGAFRDAADNWAAGPWVVWSDR